MSKTTISALVTAIIGLIGAGTVYLQNMAENPKTEEVKSGLQINVSQNQENKQKQINSKDDF